MLQNWHPVKAMANFKLYFDGSCRPNPGDGGAGAIVYVNGEKLLGIGVPLGTR